MKKILFPLVAILLLAACSSSEDTINEPEPPKYEINSVILVGDLKLQSYIFEGDYYIEAIDESGNKVFTIKDKAENYTHDLGFGDKREYIVKGCFLQSALKKDDCFYILGDLYSSELVAHPHKFILKIKDGKLVLKKYFDKEHYYGFEQTIFYPEAIADWYGEYVAIYKTVRTGIYEIGVLDSDLKQTIGNNDPGAERWVKEIERNNYMPISYSNMVYIYNSMVMCVDISKWGYNKYLIWQVPITDEEIRVNKSTYSLDGNNVVVDIDATTKVGEKKKYHLVLNKETGELVNPQS
ncbi:membrane lipoprotein lipid attachment site-containing protein [Bacteroides acidifaciens]|uniref:membrane lipoprotein lipid attachment site-containing protein n=1 Tax=Bacteroides acidifaciens TaxID=85831 RepID=UPI00158BB2A6|nr:membrane lipoprotein lipid attachment site-containing protein [Bacteroides acidifaciens]MDE6822209.1 membrane lipoprotein lipid attachment site-containing protein [Bacteroides acidifaciens]